MATRTVHKQSQIKMFVGAGLAALAMAFAVACEADAAAEPIVVVKSFPGAAAVDIVDVMRETGNPDANRVTGYKFIDVGAYEDTDLAPFIGVTPDLAESEMLREIGRFDADFAPAAYAVTDIKDVLREVGRYEADIVTLRFHIKDIPDPLREIGRHDSTLTTQMPDSELLREIGRSN